MRKKYYLLLLLIVLLIFAGFIFYTDYFHKPINPIRNGVLLQPPLNMKNFNMFIADDDNWQIAYVPAVCCDSTCGKELLQLSQLQKKIEKNGKQIHLKLIAKQTCEVHDSRHIDMEAISIQQVKQFQATLKQPNETSFDMTGKIYVIDPQQNVLVYYLSSTNPSDILNDLRLLVTARA